jgi:hypothetical protein
VGESHLSANVNTDGYVEKVEAELFEIFVAFAVIADLIHGKQIVFSLFLTVEFHEIFPDFLHAVLCVLDGLYLKVGFLFGEVVFLFLLHFLLHLLFLIFLVLSLSVFFLIIFRLFPDDFSEPILSAHHGVAALQQFLVVLFLFFLLLL